MEVGGRRWNSEGRRWNSVEVGGALREVGGIPWKSLELCWGSKVPQACAWPLTLAWYVVSSSLLPSRIAGALDCSTPPNFVSPLTPLLSLIPSPLCPASSLMFCTNGVLLRMLTGAGRTPLAQVTHLVRERMGARASEIMELHCLAHMPGVLAWYTGPLMQSPACPVQLYDGMPSPTLHLLRLSPWDNKSLPHNRILHPTGGGRDPRARPLRRLFAHPGALHFAGALLQLLALVGQSCGSRLRAS